MQGKLPLRPADIGVTKPRRGISIFLKILIVFLTVNIATSVISIATAYFLSTDFIERRIEETIAQPVAPTGETLAHELQTDSERSVHGLLHAAILDGHLFALNDEIKVLTAILVLSMVAVFLVSLYGARYLSKPIVELATAAARLARGELDTRIAVSTSGEVQTLVDSFNRMSEDLRETMAARDALLQNLEQEIGERKLVEHQLECLKQGGAPIPTIAITASADREQCLAAAINDYSVKPFDQAELKGMLTRWLPATGNQLERSTGSGTGMVSAPQQPTPALDPAVIADLRKLSDKALRKLNTVFRTNSARLIDTLRSALAQGDTDTVRSTAHSLKSASGSMGAQRVQTLCNTLEIRAQAGLLVDGETQLEQIERECKRALVALHEAFNPSVQGNQPGVELDGGATILIADDDPVAQLATRLALEDAGFCVHVAGDGPGALAMFNENPSDLLLLDVEMPGMGGFQVCEAIRRNPDGATVPVLMVTGHDDLDSINRAYEAGATDFVSKPINWTVLIQRLRYMLRTSSLTRALAKSQNSLATAQQLARMGSWEWAPAALFETFQCSDELYRLFGIELGACPVTLDTLVERIRPADRVVLRDAVLAPLRTGEPSRATVHIERAEGVVHTLLVYSEAVLGGRSQLARLRGTFQDVTELKQAEEQIHQLAYYDSLTGLPNRRNFSDQASQELALARRHQHQFGVLFLDLDDFKHINDSLGHHAGDLLLKAVAERMRAILRSSDGLARSTIMDDGSGLHALARVGGDEFTILLRQLRSSRDAAMIAERLLEALSQPVDLAGHSVIVTSSIGIAIYPNDGDDIKVLFQNADTAMYHAKRAGKAAYYFYDESMNAAVMARLTVEQELRRALENGEFRLEYQPQLDLVSNTVTGVEALLRWQNERLGRVAPDDFIPLAEETGLIIPIGEWVLRAACTQAKAWQDEGLTGLRVAVNLSARQFAQPRLTQRVARILDDTGLESRYLELELTESALMEDVEQAIQKMDALKAMGVHLAIDDFGTGYSSLSYLKRFPIDRLKIDRVFLQNVECDSDNAAITSAVVSMGHNLKLKVVAEGVETEDQRDFLEQHQCDEMQGYYLSRPLTPEQLVTLLKSRHK